ncbi:M23 family metallopeptidase [Cryobacterium sp. SO2]|uniref:M23 family metallopeptidase n=1 Tax=Cryobacterium sp. SO2 TaxID=1897060 RepID=UPI00223D5B54|nr:M23 family metallopeptidase [Cryobacterium sp. SO2]WEO76052.1 M23 family metallopeptidase [Cryobacterium sp. SO2]
MTNPQREKRRMPRRNLNALSAAALVLSLVSGAGWATQPAAAAEYPSWSDVENARANEATKQDQISTLNTLISGLTSEVTAAQEESTRRGTEFEEAQGAFDEATYRATTLQAQADEAGAQAALSSEQAGRLASGLARSGGPDLSLAILMAGDNTDALLYQLGAMSKLTERSSAVYDQAASDRNSASALTDQAKIAQNELGALAKDAESALTRAIAASAAVEVALAEQQANAGTMQAQLAVLTEGRAATEADFAKGEEARRAAEAVAAAAAAAKVPTGGSGGSSGSGSDSGQLSGQGWALPVSGWISDDFGPRPNKPVAGVGAFHYGTDLAAGCGVPVKAATGGTVVYSGYLGSYGNWVLIDHGNGVQTGYAHNSENLVSNGQQVSAGQTISLVGTTGASSGCHSHFEVRVDGARIDPEPFMSARGINLG